MTSVTPSPSSISQSLSREVVELALDRIETLDPLVNAVCTVNPAALDDAAARDREAADGRSRGPLHGLPVLLKDNVDTADLATTAGSLALVDVPPPAADAPLVERLRAAGMVVLGKANLSEWANLRDEHSTSGWSGYGGLTRNPYALNRSAGGSSSGSGAAVGAGIVRYAVGTETDGSITCPSAFNGCVGIKPTVGSVPSAGVVPISSSQDSPGPMTATVAEAAAMLGVMTGAGAGHYAPDAKRIGGKRIGVPRKVFWGYSPQADAVAEQALETLSQAGAVIVDETDLESMVDYPFDDELVVLLAEFKVELDRYLSTRPGDGPKSMEEVVAFNREHADTELTWFGQSFLEQALKAPGPDSPEYAEARAKCLKAGRDDGIDAVLREHRLDAFVTPAYAPAIPIDLVNEELHHGACTQPTAMAGYPILTVPAGTSQGLPVAVSFWSTANSEASLLDIGHAFELAREPLPAPTFPQFV
jgi:amidase